MLVNTRFSEGQKVYHRGDNQNNLGIVTGFSIRGDIVYYYVSWGDREETVHRDFELTEDKTFG